MPHDARTTPLPGRTLGHCAQLCSSGSPLHSTPNAGDSRCAGPCLLHNAPNHAAHWTGLLTAARDSAAQAGLHTQPQTQQTALMYRACLPRGAQTMPLASQFALASATVASISRPPQRTHFPRDTCELAEPRQLARYHICTKRQLRQRLGTRGNSSLAYSLLASLGMSQRISPLPVTDRNAGHNQRHGYRNNECSLPGFQSAKFVPQAWRAPPLFLGELTGVPE